MTAERNLERFGFKLSAKDLQKNGNQRPLKKAYLNGIRELKRNEMKKIPKQLLVTTYLEDTRTSKLEFVDETIGKLIASMSDKERWYFDRGVQVRFGDTFYGHIPKHYVPLLGTFKLCKPDTVKRAQNRA